MTNDQSNDTLSQMGNVATETAQTLVDAAYLAQRQTAELVQAWLNVLGQGQQQQREVATRLMQQAQEAQNLLRQYVQDSIRTSTEAFTSAAQAGANTMSQAAQTGANAVGQAAQTGANTVSETVNRTAQGATGGKTPTGK